jgi:hypothetical protein
MTPERLPAVVRPVFGVLAGALFLDLFLDWRVASVSTPALDLRTGASGWAGWGAVAGILLLALIAWEVRLLLRDTDPVLPEVALSTALACGAAAFAVLGFFTGTARVDVGGVLAVDTGSATWAAYAGLVLGGLLAVAAVVRYVVEPGAHRARPRVTAHGSV